MTCTIIRATAIREVEFVCPHCGVDRHGAVVDLRRWLGVGRLRVAPLARIGSMIECGSCSNRCGVGVLNVPTAAQLEHLLRNAFRYAIVAVIRSGRGLGPASDDVDRHAVTLMRGAGYLYDRFDLEDDLQRLSGAAMVLHVRALADELTTHGKHSLLHKLHTLATVDGPIRAGQREALLRIGVALGMGAPQINGIIAVGDAAILES